MRAFVLIALLLCGCSESLSAGGAERCVRNDTVARYVVRLENDRRFGSGVIVGTRAILSLKHVGTGLRLDTNMHPLDIWQRPHEEHTHHGRVVQEFDVGADDRVQLIVLQEPLRWLPPAAELRASRPVAGECVTGVGYPFGPGAEAIAFGEYRTDGPPTPAATDRIFISPRNGAFPLIGGTSGGGIFDRDGRLIGLIQSSAQRYYNFFERVLFGKANLNAVPVDSLAGDIKAVLHQEGVVD